MTLIEFKSVIESTGIPCAYRMFPVDEAPDLPYICYFEGPSDNFAADGKVYHHVKTVYVELYSLNKDTTSEHLVEAAFDDNNIYWEKDETFLEDEKCYEIIYTLEV